MKINFQKILVTFSAVCIMSCFAVPVSADDYFDTGYRSEYGNTLETFMNDLGVYLNGEITIDEFLERSNGLYNENRDEFADRLGMGLVVDVTDNIANGIMDNVAKAEQAVKDALNPYQTTQSVPSVDTKGYGILVYHYNRNTGYCTAVVYGQYGVINSKNTISVMGAGEAETFSATSGESFGVTTFTNGYSNGLTNNNIYYTVVYGDLRYEDGTSAEDKTNNSDITYTDKPVYNFSNLSDSELEELLNEVDETLKRENPDLSTMEGLLESIYYRLGMLDSDNDNALLSQVITAIQLSSGELKTVLEEIRDSLTDGVSGDNSDLAEKLEKMITTDDFIIDEEAYRNYSTVLKLRLDEKFIFADDLKELVLYAFDKYANSSENPQLELSYNDNKYTVDLNVYNEYMPTIRFMIAAFTYVSFALHTYRKIPSYINGGDNL